MQIKFRGAIGASAGSLYLLTSSSAEIMADCSLFQGYRRRNLFAQCGRLHMSPAGSGGASHV
jgi:hypothetical protein